MSDVGIKSTSIGGTGIGSKLGAWPYGITIFLSASMVFLVQPMFAKMATPLLGGAPAVWNVSLVCFQAALLAGYAYAHGLARIKSVKVQVSIHAALLVAAGLIALPMSISGLFGTPDPAHPILWLAGTFMVSIAPPFAVISATAPLIQSWYAKTGRPDADDPYHLYAASNAGSLLGLAAYPLLMEPLATLSQQSGLWASGYALLACLLIACGVLAFRSNRNVTVSATMTAAPLETKIEHAVWKERLVWLALAFVPSSLLVGATTHISTDVAAAPFLWAPPLMAYIVTFIIVFSKKPLISTQTANTYLPHAIMLAVALIAMPTFITLPWPVVILVHIGALFLASLALHGTLADRRPPAARLTEFFLIMSLGGVLGSAFNALVAPIIFPTVIEYPLMLAIALILRHVTTPNRDDLRQNVPALVALSVVTVLTLGLGILGQEPPEMLSRGLLAIVLVIAILFATSRWVPVLALVTALSIGWIANPVKNSFSERGFFGVIKTTDWDDRNVRLMLHGTTLHGAQLMKDTPRPTPLTYYHQAAPIGQAFAAYTDTAETVGVVGLGVGSVACYAAPGQDYRYYEIDPLVAKVARDETRFTFLSTCTPDAPIILGDARITLGDEAAGTFDILLLDAFSSDAVPAHLLTREAMSLYLSRLSDDGVLVFHISNRHLALLPTLARVGAAEDADMVFQSFRPKDDSEFGGPVASDVVVLAKSEAALARLLEDDRWTPLAADDGRPWSDDYSNIIGAMIEKHAK